MSLSPLPRLPLALDDVVRVFLPLDRARSLPARAYTDEAVFAFEERAIFEPAWRCVGREEELAQPGSWLSAPITEEGILVVRGEDLNLRAFYNICRHRAAPLVSGACGRARMFECPYHGWTYDLRGALRSAEHVPEQFDPNAHGLRSLRASVWRGFVFVNESSEAPELEVALASPPPWFLRAHLAPLALAFRSEYEIRANWKLVVANFQESHHFPRVHPALERLTPTRDASSRLADAAWLGGMMDIGGDAETVSRSGSRFDRPYLVPEADRRRVFDALLFPAMMSSLQPDYLLTFRLVPRASDRTLVVFDVWFHPAARAEGEALHDVIAFWERVNEEDRAICERQQIGIGSRGYTPSVYTRVEDGVHAFEKRVAEHYAIALRGQREAE